MRRKPRPNDEVILNQMREKGLPWLTAAVAIVLVALGVGITYFILNKTEDVYAMRTPVIIETIPNIGISRISLESRPRLNLGNATRDYDRMNESDLIKDVIASEESEREGSPEEEVDELYESAGEAEEEAGVSEDDEVVEEAGTALNSEEVDLPTTPSAPPPWPSLTNRTTASVYSKSAVTCQNPHCAEIGKNILSKGGNAVEAAISVEICMGALEPHLTGLGGGLMATIYEKKRGKCSSVNGREMSPQAANPKLFHKNPIKANIGHSSAAVPGALHALWKMFTSYGSGKVTWTELFLPTIEKLQKGFPISGSFARSLKAFEGPIIEDKILRQKYVNWKTKSLYVENDTVIDFQYADTLRRLATSRDSSQLFYRGDMANQIVREMKINGGLIQKSDLVNYSSEIVESLQINVENVEICAPAPPSRSAATLFMINIVKEALQNNSTSDITSDLFFHYLIEAQKYSFPLLRRLGDPNLVPSSHFLALNLTTRKSAATILEKLSEFVKVDAYYGPEVVQSIDSVNSHINVIDSNGNSVALSSSLNSKFGSFRRSEKLGILWNNAISSFSFDEKDENGLEPKKRPMTTMSPVVGLKKGEVFFSIGSTGSDLSSLSSLANSILYLTLLEKDPIYSVDASRVHTIAHSGTSFEVTMPFKLTSALTAHGQDMSPVKKLASIHLLGVDHNGLLTAVHDERSEGNQFSGGQ